MSSSSSPRASAQRKLWLGLSAGGLVVLCLCLVLGVGGGVALYLGRTKTPAAEGAAVEYVLDASPRMSLPGESGAPRLAVARGVLADIVRPADPTVLSGLRVFGTGAVKQACQDTSLLVPLGPSSQKLISDKASALEAGQSTDSALAQAIVAAIRDLATKKGPHSLVVVTGGADSCNPNAAQVVAQEAKHSGISLDTYVVGFGVSDSEAQAIKVVVEQTPQARYLDAKTGEKLRLTLRGVQDRIEHPATSYTGQSACDYQYLPLRQGASWEYSMAGQMYSETVTAVSGGATQAQVTEAFDSGYFQGTFDMNCGPNGIEGFEMNQGTLGQGVSVQMKMTSHSGTTLVPPDKLAPGTTWTSSETWTMTSSQAGQTVDMTTSIDKVYTAVGVESVTTPAGTFEAIRVEIQNTTTTTVPPGLAGATAFSNTSTYASTEWYVRGVGQVRMAGGSGSSAWESELVAYYVPGMPGASHAAFTPPAAVVTPLEAASPTSTPGPGRLFGDFPLYPGAVVDPSGTSEEENQAQLRLKSQDTLNQVAEFYEKELTARGWSRLSAQVNTSGGPMQWWSKDDLRLDLAYQPADQGEPPATVLLAVVHLLDQAKVRAALPADFPLPDGTQFMYADTSEVRLFVPQDYAAAVAFFKGKQPELAAQGWTEGTATPMEGSCGGDCTSEQPNWPAGSTPMPWPTADPRGSTVLSWIAPNKDEFLLQIWPRQGNTEITVQITLKSPASAGLPADVPLYQGAEVQMVAPGMISLMAPASVDAVTKFYDTALTTAGWQSTSMAGLTTWTKGSVQIGVSVTDAGGTKSYVTIMCMSGCTTP